MQNQTNKNHPFVYFVWFKRYGYNIYNALLMQYFPRKLFINLQTVNKKTHKVFVLK